MRHQRRSRAGFTLVEMLVATALIMVIMLIISQAFASASKTFNTMRTAGYMQERLRTGISMARKDLSADHFGPPYGSARGGPRVSDQRLDQPGWQPPRAGYFEIRQLGEADPLGVQFQVTPWGTPLPPASIVEPYAKPLADGDGLTSTRAVNHRLRFTVRLPDGPGTELFSAKFHPAFTRDPQVNAFVNQQDILYSRWAEITYLLYPMQDDTSPTGIANTKSDGTGLTRYTLRRRVRLLAPRSVDYYMDPNVALQIVLGCDPFIDVIPPFIAGPAPDNVRALPNQGNFVTLRMPGPEALNGPDVDYTPTFINPAWPPVWINRLKFPEETRPPGAPPTPTAYLTEYRVHPTGDDILMTDVISMDIKAAWFFNPKFNATVQPSYPYPPPYQPSPPCAPPVQPGAILPSMFAANNMDEPFWDLPPSILRAIDPVFGKPNPRWFDTGTQKLVPYPPVDPADWDQPDPIIPGSNSPGFLTPGQLPNGTPIPAVTTVPSRINVRTLQIKLRIWDPRAEQARQATLISEI